MLTVGTDSYVTLADANGYITERFRSTDPARLRWGGIEEADKEILLRQACAELEGLAYQGRKAVAGQPLAFPRIWHSGLVLPSAVPPEVRQAQIELALWLSDGDARTEETARAGLRAQGVASFSLGDLSEAYTPGAAPAGARLCPQAARLLRGWLTGGFRLC